MKQILIAFALAALVAQTQAGICQTYLDKVSYSELQDNFTQIITCVSQKLALLDNIQSGTLKIDEIQKQYYDAKFWCFGQIKNPTQELKDLFQCFKNYYEAKFDTSVNIISLENQSKGTDRSNWGDEELKQQIDQDIKQRSEPTNIALLIFCVIVFIAILSLLIAIAVSKYRIHIQQQQNSLGMTNTDFGSSASYRKQQDDNQ
ncbi:hypothetical protein ABPG72_008455 [Tetrahymena utriculariae]